MPSAASPIATKEDTVVVVPAVNVQVAGLVIVKTLNVLEPINFDVPEPVVVRLLYVNPPPLKIEVAPVNEIVEVSGLRTNSGESTCYALPAPEYVVIQVPEPIVRVLTPPVDLKLAKVTLKSLASKVP